MVKFLLLVLLIFMVGCANGEEQTAKHDEIGEGFTEMRGLEQQLQTKKISDLEDIPTIK
ncbi:hypothetical protein [Alkalibacillus haloalkaliphilus]|uniref:hypothetical protein n=1 Tax=Alkalibacillus haloalkaliphilus TaxID=94136 RepID=UPI00293582D0|nr:hypothetical protein [Alkalibacillus haloalkaliphilus]MDV2582916.1 hypothetical protein [Alkalibacillus haloalkaliphilus]